MANKLVIVDAKPVTINQVKKKKERIIYLKSLREVRGNTPFIVPSFSKHLFSRVQNMVARKS